MIAPTFSVVGVTARLMRGAATDIHLQAGHQLVQVATGNREFLLGLYDAEEDRLDVFNGPALIAALRKPLTT